MAFLGLKVPYETARLLGQVKVEGEKEDLSSMHITILYLGKELPIEAVTRAIEVAYEVTSNTKPFTVKTQLVTSFSVNKDSGIPIIARVESAPLLALRNALTAAFDAEGVNYDKKYPEYKPHVTLAYKKPTGDSETGVEYPADQNIPQLEWGVGEMVLWGGDAGDEKLSVTFPFDLALSKKAAYRAFVRLAAKETSTERYSMGHHLDLAEKVARRFDQSTNISSTRVTPTQQKVLLTAKRHGGRFSVTVEFKNGTRYGGREMDAAFQLVEQGLMEKMGEPERTSETKGGKKRYFLIFNFRLTPEGENLASSLRFDRSMVYL